MQNIANNNAGAYIFNENEERNANRRAYSRESIVLFDPLPAEIHVDDPLEPYAEWFSEYCLYYYYYTFKKTKQKPTPI